MIFNDNRQGSKILTDNRQSDEILTGNRQVEPPFRPSTLSSPDWWRPRNNLHQKKYGQKGASATKWHENDYSLRTKKSKCDRYKSSLSIDDRVQAEREQDNSTWKWLHVVFDEKESVLGATWKSNLLRCMENTTL